MNSLSRGVGILILVLVGIAACALCVVSLGRTTVSINNIVVSVDVVDTHTERAKGLSGRASLGMQEGMLFVFDVPGTHTFWMKDMLFPIDILWFDADKRLIFIEESLSPDTFPHTFGPDEENTQFVLEVPAGFIQEHKIKIGDEIKIGK